MLHDLMLQKQARLSFEYEVSSFESGGARVTKIYDSIKRGIIRKKENNTQNTQSWGKKKKDGIDIPWGLETTAAGTSQFCTKCGRWAMLGIFDAQDYELTNAEDGLCKTNIIDGEIRLLSSNPGTKMKGEDIKKLVYRAMRPNIIDEEGKKIGHGMKIVKDGLSTEEWNNLTRRFGVGKPRGNMGIFVCPYTDCNYLADADIQAAFNIAVRGYIKTINPNIANKLGGLNKIFLTQEEARLKLITLKFVLD